MSSSRGCWRGRWVVAAERPESYANALVKEGGDRASSARHRIILISIQDKQIIGGEDNGCAYRFLD
ncbi:MAG TPA: hypothetical protein ENG33_07030 [Chloroflexi bacterium]|nr:hypothetical protein [Chloroflexota bacterium]